MTDELDLLLFACLACARDECAECIHLTAGAWCPHRCFWLWSYPRRTDGPTQA